MADRESFFDRHYHFFRRLHSLTGIVPVGVYLFPHLTTNASIVWGRIAETEIGQDLEAVGIAPHPGVEAFQHEVDFIHGLPALILIEWLFIFIPILIHTVLGLYFARTGRGNARRYAYQDNWRYSVQRWTGYIAVIFIFLHVASLRFGWDVGGLMPAFEPHEAASSTAIHFQESPLNGWSMAVFYLVGVLSIVFHFANGLWTAAITWGLTITEEAQRRWGWVCAAVGLFLSLATVASVYGFMTLDIEQARGIEEILRGR